MATAAAANIAAGKLGPEAQGALDLIREISSQGSWEAAYALWLAKHGGRPPSDISQPEICRDVELLKLSNLKTTAKTAALRALGEHFDTEILRDVAEAAAETGRAAAAAAASATTGARDFYSTAARAASGVLRTTAAAFDNEKFNKMSKTPTIDGKWSGKKFIRIAAAAVKGGQGQYLSREYVNRIASENPHALTRRAHQILRFFNLQDELVSLTNSASDENAAVGREGGSRRKLKRSTHSRGTRRHRRK